ncbi:hypothetical protein GCM10009828_091320 [Actinoplanes couchii]|uniref:Uncharacterized protein n=1 Tax=Actinoplanes couchii TaxID=403638 RepID=A0ABQ3XH27_9ACTN|nr:hypothetical protein Aco03nite_062120 [Actinoplanes couchii]
MVVGRWAAGCTPSAVEEFQLFGACQAPEAAECCRVEGSLRRAECCRVEGSLRKAECCRVEGSLRKAE